MHFQAIDGEVELAMQTTPYNPPDLTDPVNRQQFAREIGSLRESLAQELAPRFKRGRGVGCDFSLPDDLFETRVVVVELLSLRSVAPAIPQAARKLLEQQKNDYRIIVVGSDVFLRTENGKCYPRFSLLIQRQDAFAYFEDARVLRDFGIELNGPEKPAPAQG